MSVILVKDASHSRVAQALACLSQPGLEVTEQDLQLRVIDDVIQRRQVAASLKGQALEVKVPFEDILDRESEVLGFLWQWLGVKYPGRYIIEQVLRKAEAEWGGISTHDRMIPQGLGLPQIFNGFCGFNAWAKEQERWLPIKMYHAPNEEWWRKDKDVQHLPTELSVIRQDLAAVMQPTDLLGRPFDLNLEEQVAWAKEQGCNDITSAEEVTYLFLRSVYECGRPLWAAGSCRTRNAFGSTYSLGVYWNAGDGFKVRSCGRDAYWDVGVLPRKSLVLGH